MARSSQVHVTVHGTFRNFTVIDYHDLSLVRLMLGQTLTSKIMASSLSFVVISGRNMIHFTKSLIYTITNLIGVIFQRPDCSLADAGHCFKEFLESFLTYILIFPATAISIVLDISPFSLFGLSVGQYLPAVQVNFEAIGQFFTEAAQSIHQAARNTARSWSTIQTVTPVSETAEVAAPNERTPLLSRSAPQIN